MRAALLLTSLRRFSAEAYFFLCALSYNAAIVFILPYLAILWRSEGLTGGQLGVLAAARPFVCSVSGQLLVGVADSRRWHFSITLVTYLLTLATRGSMGLLHGFVAHLLLVLASEACQAPFSIITDAAIAASTDEAGYGRRRIWASFGWGALAPLSGWIVGVHGVPASIAVYFGLVCAALLPALLLPLRELGRRRTSSLEAEAAAPTRSCGSKAPGGSLARASGGGSALLLPPGGQSSHELSLDERQHAGQAAELAIELLAASKPPPLDADAAAAQAVGRLLVQRLQSKVSQAGSVAATAPSASPQVQWPPLVTTADEDAAQQAASARASAAAEAVADPAGWTIPASRAAPAPVACSPGRAGLPPLAPTPVGSAGGGSMLARTASGATPVGSYGSGGLARTTSAATTAFFSVRSESSLSGVPGLYSPSSEQQPRSALLAQLSGAGAYATITRTQPPVLSPHHGRPPAGPLSRQSSEAATVYGTPRSALPAPTLGAATGAPQPSPPPHSLLKQPSALSQALTGFELDLSTRDGTAAAAAGGSGGGGGLPSPAGLLSQASVLSQALDGFGLGEQLELEGTVSDGAHLKGLSPPALAITVDCRSGHSGRSFGPSGPSATAAGLVPTPSFCGEAPAAAPAALASLGAAGSAHKSPHARREVSVWQGIRQMCRNPHHAAFFATMFLCGIGYGAQGYLNLYLKEEGAPGLLLGMAQLVGVCGSEMILFLTQPWWLPRIGLERATALGMVGWIVRLACYTLVPLMPNLWCVLPIELLQGCCFTFCYGVGTLRAKEIAPPHLRSSTQSLVFALYYGVGPGISGLAGGFIYEALGMRFVFIIFALVLVAGWAAVLLALRWATRGERAAAAAARAAQLPPL